MPPLFFWGLRKCVRVADFHCTFSMSDLFDSLTALQAEWQALLPLQAEHQDRLWRKFRLEWNYHSNHIEGNTLTYGETELLLLHDRTTGNHSHREYLEMKAHDVGIEHVRSLAADSERIITEADIRDLNKIILKEPFWKAAETADGQATRKQIIPGEYKTSPNNVRTASGDIFYFASVEDTPPKMQALAAWLRQELEMPTLHPVALATKLHHEFVLIHPFDDGNGRVARLLVNYVLLRSGYLPVIVRSEDKANYLTALRLADAGDLLPLTEYLALLEEWSLGIGIKAAKDEPINEPGDVEKEIAVFIREQQGHQKRVVAKSSEVIRDIYELGIKRLFELLDSKLQKLEPLFSNHELVALPATSKDYGSTWQAFENNLNWTEPFEEFTIKHQFVGFKGLARDPFNISISLAIRFETFQYWIEIQGGLVVKKLYSEPILADEAEKISTQSLSTAFEMVKQLSAQR